MKRNSARSAIFLAACAASLVGNVVLIAKIASRADFAVAALAQTVPAIRKDIRFLERKKATLERRLRETGSPGNADPTWTDTIIVGPYTTSHPRIPLPMEEATIVVPHAFFRTTRNYAAESVTGEGLSLSVNLIDGLPLSDRERHRLDHQASMFVDAMRRHESARVRSVEDGDGSGQLVLDPDVEASEAMIRKFSQSVNGILGTERGEFLLSVLAEDPWLTVQKQPVEVSIEDLDGSYTYVESDGVRVPIGPATLRTLRYGHLFDRNAWETHMLTENDDSLIDVDRDDPGTSKLLDPNFKKELIRDMPFGSRYPLENDDPFQVSFE